MTTIETIRANRRNGHIAALRVVADLLEANPALPTPSIYENEIAWNFWGMDGEDVKAEMASVVRILPTKFTKNAPGTVHGDAYYELRGSLSGVIVVLTAKRDEVCERVVTGTETVTRTVAAAPAVKAHEVTDTVETVEWVCTSLLAAAVAA